jgi:hypothetical protein
MITENGLNEIFKDFKDDIYETYTDLRYVEKMRIYDEIQDNYADDFFSAPDRYIEDIESRGHDLTKYMDIPNN